MRSTALPSSWIMDYARAHGFHPDVVRAKRRFGMMERRYLDALNRACSIIEHLRAGAPLVLTGDTLTIGRIVAPNGWCRAEVTYRPGIGFFAHPLFAGNANARITAGWITSQVAKGCRWECREPTGDVLGDLHAASKAAQATGRKWPPIPRMLNRFRRRAGLPPR